MYMRVVVFILSVKNSIKLCKPLLCFFTKSILISEACGIIGQGVCTYIHWGYKKGGGGHFEILPRQVVAGCGRTLTCPRKIMRLNSEVLA